MFNAIFRKLHNKSRFVNLMAIHSRTLISLVLTLYFTRLSIGFLGVDAYGLFAVVNAVILLLGFGQNALISTSQRYLATSLVDADSHKETPLVFARLFWIHIFYSVIVLVFVYTVGFYVVHNLIDVEESVRNNLFLVNQVLGFWLILRIVRIPFEALFASHEKFGLVSVLNVLESVIKLLAVLFLVVVSSGDILIYSAIICFSGMATTLMFVVVSLKSFKELIGFDLHHYSDFKSIFGFLSWNTLSSSANVISSQGAHILINKTAGVELNATLNIANQLAASASGFALAFVNLYSPTILKNYAIEEGQNWRKLTNDASLFGLYVICVISAPLVAAADEIALLWLGRVPESFSSFVYLVVFYQLVDVWQAPMSIVIGAEGNLRKYSIILSLFLISNLPISIGLLAFGGGAELILLTRLLVNIFSSVFRIFYCRHFFDGELNMYLTEVVVKGGLFVLGSYVAGAVLFDFFPANFRGLLLFGACSIFLTSSLYLVLFFSRQLKEGLSVILKL